MTMSREIIGSFKIKAIRLAPDQEDDSIILEEVRASDEIEAARSDIWLYDLTDEALAILREASQQDDAITLAVEYVRP